MDCLSEGRGGSSSRVEPEEAWKRALLRSGVYAQGGAGLSDGMGHWAGFQVSNRSGLATPQSWGGDPAEDCAGRTGLIGAGLPADRAFA